MINDFSADRQDFWKNIDPKYYLNNTGNAVKRRKFFAGVMAKNGITSVLELGCNSGSNLLYISRECIGAKLVGIDICEDAIKHGKEKEHNPAELLVCSIYDLSQFADKSFDVVFTMGVLMHINSERTPIIIKEMARIATKYIVNIERNGKESILSYGANNAPHAFSHDFVSIYKKIGLEPNIMATEHLIGSSSNGGADHFVWANLGQTKLKIK